MTTTWRIPEREDGERGFVLVGVVMFVLALTIIGISLFGLSSFEAKFLNQSADRDQAFYDATGGLERAKWALAKFDSLGLLAVKNGVPYGDGVVLVTAWNANGDTTGKVDWTGGHGPVGIRVVAIRGKTASDPGQRRVVQAKYNPQEIKNLYQNLLTSAGPIWSLPSLPITPQVLPSICMTGTVWQQSTSPDTSWSTFVTCGSHDPLTLRTVPIPDVANFINQWLPTAQQVMWSDPFLTLNAGVGNIGVFQGPPGPISPDGFGFETDPGKQIDVHVTGTAVWLVPAGLEFHQHVRINDPNVFPGSDPNAVLVIVAGKSQGIQGPTISVLGTAPAGIWLRGGMEAHVPLILISDGQVAVNQEFSPSSPSTTAYLSVFGGEIFLSGPLLSSGFTMQLLHDPSLDSAVLDPLINAGLLPNLPPGQNRLLSPIAGQWSEVTDSNPQNN